ncbi:MAG: hypothetical protein AB7I27_14170 [Bacteriovoracaceae bacterium]
MASWCHQFNYQLPKQAKFKLNKSENQMNNLIKISVILAFAAVASGNLPKILFQVRRAQLQLIQDSKASKWPRAMTLPSK